LLVEFFAPVEEDLDLVGLEKANIQIISGNHEAAMIAQTLLKRQGVNASVGDTQIPLAGTSTITVYKSKPATAHRIASLLRLEPTSIQTANDANAPADIVVDLGRNYNSCQR
jgi:hypothetical protein